MEEWYFIFGDHHKYPDGYCKISGTSESARLIMQSKFQDNWCFQFSKKDFNTINKTRLLKFIDYSKG